MVLGARGYLGAEAAYLGTRCQAQETLTKHPEVARTAASPEGRMAQQFREDEGQGRGDLPAGIHQSESGHHGVLSEGGTESQGAVWEVLVAVQDGNGGDPAGWRWSRS